MTVIAWDGRQLVADKMCSYSSGHFSTVTKIFQRHDGYLYGVAGSIESIPLLQNWFESGGNPSEFPTLKQGEEAELLCIDLEDNCYYMVNNPYGVKIESRYFAIGVGSPAAEALMEAGMDAKRAVEQVCKMNIYCGGGIDVLVSV